MPISGTECQRRKNKTVYCKWQNLFKQSILTWFYQLLCDCCMSKGKGMSTIYWPLKLTKNCLISGNMLLKLISSWSSSFKVKVFPRLPLRYYTCKNSPLADWTAPKYVNTFRFVSYFTATASTTCGEVLVCRIPHKKTSQDLTEN